MPSAHHVSLRNPVLLKLRAHLFANQGAVFSYEQLGFKSAWTAGHYIRAIRAQLRKTHPHLILINSKYGITLAVRFTGDPLPALARKYSLTQRTQDFYA